MAWAFWVERGTGIEPALSAWEVASCDRQLPAGSLSWVLAARLPASDHESLLPCTDGHATRMWSDRFGVKV
jgi:hypothetical protein